ncbi:MAG TPA: glycosyltransferase family 39 protein [Polyangia bacterium]|jgi:4-amino-4-deoxy-L-arabinose transferase-like glycosyltransferase
MTEPPADADAPTSPSALPAPVPGATTLRGAAGASFFDRFTERQMALLVILFGLALYIPFAGSFGFYDPWESHYSEVARQMMQRHDYISLWWPGAPIDADHFWSKPVLSFWLMSLSMTLFGLGGHPAPGTMALSTRAEWAARLPFCLLGVVGVYAVYLCVSRFVSRRAGVIAAVVTATSPLYSLVARQAMTDMAFVGPMTMALALGALALFDDEDATLERREVSLRVAGLGRRTLSWPHDPLFYVAIGLFTVAALPQLVVNSIQLVWHLPVGRGFAIPGVVVMLPYFAGFVAFLLLSARVRYRAPLYLFIAATLCGLATLAKGIAGLGLPVLVFLAYLGFTWNWKRLSRAQLLYGVLVALLAVAVVAVPWHQAMLVLHGKPFWDELYGDNHWRRLVVGRHGDRGTFEYFLRELGYATLPWIALAPSALAYAVMRPVRDVRRQGIFWFGAIWFVAAYALVSLSVTKFHHYILPALPGLAIAIGCFLDDLLERRATAPAAAAALVGLPLLALVVVDLAAVPKNAQHFIWLFSYDYINAPAGRPWPPALDFGPWLISFGVLFGIATLALGVRRLQRGAALGLCLAAVAFTYFLLDGYMMKVTPYWTQKNLIATYYKLRTSPDEHLLVWQMYWRGENFYTQNEIFEGPAAERTVFLGDKNVENLKAWMAKHRGHRAFFVVERSRWSQLEGLVPPETKASLHIVDESNMKFCLAQIQL